MRSAERRKVNVLEMKCLRSLVGVSRMDRVSNEEVRTRAGINKQTIMIYYKKMAVQRITYIRINSLAFKGSSVHIDCY